MLGATEVCYLYACRVNLAAGTADRDYPQLVASAVCNQPSLGTKTVNAVDDVVIFFCHQDSDIFNAEKLLYGVDLTMRIYLLNPFGHDLHLGLAKCVAECMQLPVYIGFGNMVEVDQRELANGG